MQAGIIFYANVLRLQNQFDNFLKRLLCQIKNLMIAVANRVIRVTIRDASVNKADREVNRESGATTQEARDNRVAQVAAAIKVSPVNKVRENRVERLIVIARDNRVARPIVIVSKVSTKKLLPATTSHLITM